MKTATPDWVEKLKPITAAETCEGWDGAGKRCMLNHLCTQLDYVFNDYVGWPPYVSLLRSLDTHHVAIGMWNDNHSPEERARKYNAWVELCKKGEIP